MTVNMYQTSRTMARTMNESGFERQPFRVDLLPPGYRFRPNDEELAVHYLHKKVTNMPLPTHFIHDVDIYKFNPETLSKKYPSYLRGDGWYFFTPRDKKYPNGNRPRRSAGNGYWKATGAEQKIKDKNNKVVGKKRSLIFYERKAPKGSKTNWIMHEYKVPAPPNRPRPDADPNNRMRLDDWVLCRINMNDARQGRVVAASSNSMEDGIEPAGGAQETDVPGLEPDTTGQEMALDDESIDGFEMQGFFNDSYNMDDTLSTSGCGPSSSEPTGAEGSDTPVEEGNVNLGTVKSVEEETFISGPVTTVEQTMLPNYDEIDSFEDVMSSYYESSEQL